MMGGMYAAISGLDANQTMLNDTANNLANVNTVGYKSASVTFADSLTQVMRGASGPTSHQRRLQPGAGRPRRAGQRDRVNEMAEGSFQSTNNPLDVAIEGPGFLRVGSGAPPAKAPYTAGIPDEHAVHPRGRPDHEHAGLPHHAGRRLRDRPQRRRDGEAKPAPPTPPAPKTPTS